MATMPLKSVNQIADFMIPVTPEMATEIAARANAANDGAASAAIYYYTGTETNRRRSAIRLTLFLEMDVPGLFGMLYTAEYHPRKDGPADLIYKTTCFIPD
jgi:hypothetical protein